MSDPVITILLSQGRVFLGEAACKRELVVVHAGCRISLPKHR